VFVRGRPKRVYVRKRRGTIIYKNDDGLRYPTKVQISEGQLGRYYNVHARRVVRVRLYVVHELGGTGRGIVPIGRVQVSLKVLGFVTGRSCAFDPPSGRGGEGE